MCICQKLHFISKHLHYCLHLNSVLRRLVVLEVNVLLKMYKSSRVGWLVGCFWLNGPLRQYFGLYRAVSQREREKEKRKDRREKKMSKQTPPAPTASAVGPCPTLLQISRTRRHWKLTQHHRTTRLPPNQVETLPPKCIRTENDTQALGSRL